MAGVLQEKEIIMFVIGKREFEADVKFDAPGLKGQEEVSFAVRYEIISSGAWEKCGGDVDTAKAIVSRLYGIFNDKGDDVSENEGVIDMVINDPLALKAIINKYISIVFNGDIDAVKKEAGKN